MLAIAHTQLDLRGCKINFMSVNFATPRILTYEA